METGNYDLSMFESPDTSAFRPGKFQYVNDKTARRGRVFPFNPQSLHFCPLESRGSNFSNIVRIQSRNPITGCLEPLYLQTPVMPTIFGLCTMVKDEGSESKYSSWKVDLSFKDMMQLRYNRETAPREVLDIENFFISLYMLDQAVLDKAKENVRTWFAGNRQLQLKPELIDGLYKSLTATRYSKNKGRYYPPALRVKAGRTHGNFNFKVFDAACQPLSPEDIQPDCQVQAVLEVTGIWFVSDSFGVGLRLLQAQVRKSELMENFCMATTTSDAEDDAVDDQPCVPPQKLTGMR